MISLAIAVDQFTKLIDWTNLLFFCFIGKFVC